MAKGTKASVSYFDGTAVGKVGKAEKGGASGGAGAKASAIDKGAVPKAPKDAKGDAAGGTENLGAEQRSLSQKHSLPSVPKAKDSWPAGVKGGDGTSAPQSAKK